MGKFVGFLLRFRWLLIILLLVGTLFWGYFITTLKVDNDTFNSIPATLKAKIDYEALKKEFPTNYTVLFLAQFSSGNLSEKIDSLRSWSNLFKSLPGISAIADLNSVQIPVKGGFLLKSDFLVSRKDSLNQNQIRDRISQNREITKLFISDDESIIGMVLSIGSMTERNAIFNGIIAKTEQINNSPHIKAYMTSEGAVPYFITKVMKRDFSILLPVCFAVIFILLYCIFKKNLYVIATIMAIVVALIWTFGLAGLLKIPFTVVMSIVPVIIFPIGVADAIHILKTYAEHKASFKGDINKAISLTYTELVKPCFLTSFTTAASFLSFAFSDISWTRYFGIFTGVAVLYAFVFNIVMLPLFLSFEKHTFSTAKDSSNAYRWLDTFWNGLEKFTLESKRWVFIIPALIVSCIIGFKMVKIDSNPVAMLPESSTIRKSDKFIGEHFGGTRFFSVMLECDDSSLTTADQWKTVQNVISFIDSQSGVGQVTSIIPLINSLSNLLSNQPFSSAAVSMLTSTKDFFGKGFSSYLKGFLSEDKHKTKITVSCRNSPGVDPLQIASDIQKYVTQNHKGWNVTISGPAVLIETMGSILVDTQVSSLIYTFVPVFLCMVLFFRSVRIGLFSIIPIIMATSFIYALMGLLGVTINSITVVTMNTCIGIGIDYAIHFVSGYIYIYKNGDDRKQILKKVIRNKGTPILFNAVVVGLGFLVLAFSSFPPNRDFGILVFLSMIVCAFFSMIFLSVLILMFGLANRKTGKEIV